MFSKNKVPQSLVDAVSGILGEKQQEPKAQVQLNEKSGDCATKPEVKTIAKGVAKGEVKKHEKKMHHENYFKDKLLEREMTSSENKKKEKIVMSMKDKEGYFKKKYGKRWKDVMYATATKQAMGEELHRDEQVMEEVEQVEEGKSDDVPFEGPYAKKPADVVDKSGAHHTPMSRARHLARQAMQKKMMKKEEIEQIDELSKSTLMNYKHDAKLDVRHSKISQDLSKRMAASGGTKTAPKSDWEDEAKFLQKHIDKRNKGIEKATDKIQSKNEEVEQIDEFATVAHSPSADSDVSTDMLSGRVQGVGKANTFKSWKSKLEGDGINRPKDETVAKDSTPARASVVAHGGGMNPVSQPKIKVGEEFELDEAKDPVIDAGAGSEPQFVQNANPSSNPSPKHTPLSRVKEVAAKSMGRLKSEMLGKAPGNN